jgi:hypothetical protein
MDIGMIITSLAPSILIIVTYYYAKKKTAEHSEALETIKGAVNGRLTDALTRIERLEAKLEIIMNSEK